MVRAFAPGKCILFGEHAVVYGHPAVAVAIDSGVEVSLEESNKWTIEGMPFNSSRHPHISHILEDIFSYDGPPLKMGISSSLFSAAGLGSSAALSNAMGAAIQAFVNPEIELNPVDLARIGHSAEAKAQSGRASPTDTATSALGGCVVVSGEAIEGTTHVFDAQLETPEGKRQWSICKVELPKNLDVSLVLGFTGVGSPTGNMVAHVAELLSKSPEKMEDMDAIANISQAGLTALSAGNLEAVGMAMNACHERLQNLEVSSPELDALVEAARPHSLGAKLTGAGGGGCMVALTREPQRVAQDIEIAGGQPLISRLGAEGVHLI
ncbi:MAG TPA: mevalonate kinase [Candidatus Thalassarchaeaceae archaeon]|nr:mevalonate kinase [Candidatus Thalassarchaeaceae archaeon]DAC36348.1 MAG TPA: mevalonate kinase [Candidatus Poseidoniales archaeon]HIH79796.1 mevalonate kinase [Candidatus Thalassarchaeaceae archaeon]HJM29638.1 mevalonate kinase [Candidatus Thalassarchaeaceae archaeon]